MAGSLTYFFLFILTAAASSVGVVVGGTGLIITSVLILFGIPPHTAVASYRVGTSGAVLTSFVQFHRHRRINYRLAVPLTLFSIAGALAATRIVFTINTDSLKRIIAITILFVLLLFLMNPKAGLKSSKSVGALKQFLGCVLAFFISAINITAGGGGGTLFSYMLLLLYGQTFLESTATKRVANGVPILIASAIFLISGIVDYKLAGTLFLANAFGGWFGSGHFLRKGDKYTRPFFMAASAFLGILLLAQTIK